MGEELYDGRLKWPFSLLLAGATGSGKTRFLQGLLERNATMIDCPPQKILFFYSQWQPSYEEMEASVWPRIEFVKGLVEAPLEKIMADVTTNPPRILCVFDDLMDSLRDSAVVAKLHTQGCHHRNVSTITVLQNLYVKGKEMRNISLNSKYMGLFSQNRDKSQCFVIGRQVMPGRGNLFREIYADAVENEGDNYGHLFLDFSPDCPEQIRFRTRMLDPRGQTVYSL